MNLCYEILVLTPNNLKGQVEGLAGNLSNVSGSFNRTMHIRHQCRKTTVLNCH